MKNRLIQSMFTLFVYASLVFGAVQLQAQGVQESAGRILEGHVRLTNGAVPERHIEVTLELHGMLVDRAQTDGRGQFIFRGLGANTYTLTVEDPEYEPVSQSVRIMSLQGSAPVRAVLTLKPLGSGAEAAPMVEDPLEKLPGGVRKEFEAGVKAAEKGNTQEAIDHYRKVIESEPDFYPAYNNLGYQYMVQQKLPEAEQAFQEALKHNQTDPGPYFGLGNIYVQSGRFDEAEKFSRQGLERDPGSSFGHYLLGTACFQTQKFSEAEKELKSALEFDPNLSLAQMTLVNLYLQQQRDREALAALNVFVDRFPNHAMIAQAREMKKQLEDWLRSRQSP